MNGKKTFTKKLNKIQRTSARKTNKTVVDSSPAEVSNSTDIGDWRITQDEDGSLILYNFATGNKVVIARP